MSFQVIYGDDPHPSRTLVEETVIPPEGSLYLRAAARDPHQIPEFDSKSLTEPKLPVLYLPPLISSLPPHLPEEKVASEHLPLVTETRLPDIDPVSLSLHKALHYFKPLGPHYSEKAYADAFNWANLQLPEDEEREWYCVVFRSKRKADSDSGALYNADRHAHEEAIRNGGLIMYWYGIPDTVTGLNLATCIWQSRKHAVAANSRPHHVKAMKLAANSYEVYTLERHVLRKEKGRKHLIVDPYVGGDVGW